MKKHFLFAAALLSICSMAASSAPSPYHLAPSGFETLKHTTVSGPLGVREFAETGLFDTDLFADGFSFGLNTFRCNKCKPHGGIITARYKRYIRNGIWIGMREIGGGFGIHTHLDQPRGEERKRYRAINGAYIATEQTPAPRVLTTPITFMPTAPEIAMGWTKSFGLGQLDASVGLRLLRSASYSAFNDVSIPVIHRDLFATISAYSKPWRKKAVSARLYGTATAQIEMPGTNNEWGMTISHMPTLRAMVGIQSHLWFVRTGLLVGAELGGAEYRSVDNRDAYGMRLRAQQAYQADLEQLHHRWQLNKDQTAGYQTVVRKGPCALLPTVTSQQNIRFVSSIYLGFKAWRFLFGSSAFLRFEPKNSSLRLGAAFGWCF